MPIDSVTSFELVRHDGQVIQVTNSSDEKLFSELMEVCLSIIETHFSPTHTSLYYLVRASFSCMSYFPPTLQYNTYNSIQGPGLATRVTIRVTPPDIAWVGHLSSSPPDHH